MQVLYFSPCALKPGIQPARQTICVLNSCFLREARRPPASRLAAPPSLAVSAPIQLVGRSPPEISRNVRALSHTFYMPFYLLGIGLNVHLNSSLTRALNPSGGSRVPADSVTALVHHRL